MEREQLRCLLSVSSANPLAARCLAGLASGRRFFYKIFVPTETQHLRGVYGVRAEINQIRGGTIEGYDALLYGMDACPQERLILHSVVFEDEWFLAFTDPEAAELVGILADRTSRIFKYHLDEGEVPESE